MIGEIIVFIFGSIIGSFLNVCIHRMPQGESVVWPGSHCPRCKKRIAAYDNIPFISYILLGGKCRICKQRISLRYPLVELITALFLVLLYSNFRLTYDFFFYAVFVCGLIIATFVDLKHKIIPDEVSVGGLVIGFVLSTIKGIDPQLKSYNIHPMLNSLLGVVVGGGIIYLSGVIFDFIYFKLLKKPPIQGETESMGGGDVKLLAMIGAFLGWKNALLAFFIAPFFGVIFGVINLVVKKDHTIAYGPFLAAASLIALFWSDKILSLIFVR